MTEADTQLATIQAEPTPLQIIAHAVQEKMPAAELRELVDLKIKMDKVQAEKEYAVAMASCQAEMPTVVKDAQSHTNRYAKLETVQKAIKPVYLRHGFAVSFSEEPAPQAGHMIVVCKVMHRAGHCETFRREGTAEKSNGARTPVQGEQSTASYLRRHMLLAIFGITVADQDNDGSVTETITEAQAVQLEEMMESYNVDKEKFWTWLDTVWNGIQNLRQLPAKLHKHVYQMLASKKPKGGA